MSIVDFPRVVKADGGWDAAELRQVAALCDAAVRQGRASAWETGTTEAGDPQAYLLGPQGDGECILCLSRLGRLYLLEDGAGHVLGEYASPGALADAARVRLSSCGYRLGLKVALAWAAGREAFEEKLEPVLAEPAQIVSHFAPQWAALA